MPTNMITKNHRLVPYVPYVPYVFFRLLCQLPDMFRNVIAGRPEDAVVCMHRGGEFERVSLFFYFASFVLTFAVPVVLLFIPW